MAEIIKMEIDSSISSNSKFHNIADVEIEKQDIFNYGIFEHEIPPEKIGDNDFEYLQSKIPVYYGMYDDYIDMPNGEKVIICKVPGEAATKVSEIVGIAVGLKSAIRIFAIEKKDIRKIAISEGKGKRLDFKAKSDGNTIEIETKGTTDKYRVKAMIDDIHQKKKGKASGISRYGFVTLLRKKEDQDESRIYATDPYSDETDNEYDGVYKYIYYYQTYLSFILDNPIYNKVVKVLINKTKYRKRIIETEKIKYSFSYNGKEYLGQCFDKRLILDEIKKHVEGAKNVEAIYRILTQNIGKEKYFLGLDRFILENINKKNIDLLEAYKDSDKYENSKDVEYIKMSDGVLFIKASEGKMPEMENQFTEEEVKRRLGEIISYEKNEWHKCGAPCRSREKKGKPCEIKTFRTYCHFHR